MMHLIKVSVKQKGTDPLLHGYNAVQMRARDVRARSDRCGYSNSARFQKHTQDK